MQKSVGYFKKKKIFLLRLALPSTSEMFGAFLTSATPTEEVIILSGNENGSFWVLLRLESNQGPSWYHTSPCWCSEASLFSTWNSVLASSTGGMLHSFRTSKNINCQESRDDMLLSDVDAYLFGRRSVQFWKGWAYFSAFILDQPSSPLPRLVTLSVWSTSTWECSTTPS